MLKLNINLDDKYETLNKCPYCYSSNIRIIFYAQDYINKIPGKFYLSKCSHCNLYFQNPRIREEFIYSFYPDKTSYYQIDDFWQKEAPEKFARNLGIKNIKEKKSVLEIGCSYGKNLLILKKLGYELKGIEINERAASYAIRKGLDIFAGSWRDFEFKEDFDIIIASMVLEHIHDFRTFLKKVAMGLKPKGILFISIPIYGGSFYIFRKHSYPLHLPNHLYFFKKYHVEMLLENFGFCNINFKYQRVNTDFIKSLEILNEQGNSLAKTLSGFIITFPIIKKLFGKMYSALGIFGFSSRLSVHAYKK